MLDLMDRRIAASAMSDLANVHARRGCVRDAITCYERALDAMRAYGDRPGEARTLRRLNAMRAAAAAQGTPARSNARTAS
jgi:hypothetical protein